MFGEANIDAFKQLALFARAGHVLDSHGNDVYLPHLERLALPITFIHGAKNACFRPESTARTLSRLAQANGRQLYERHVIPGYGHIDCIFGKNAARDVFPLIAAHLDKTALV
jgi:cholesterol oxidase